MARNEWKLNMTPQLSDSHNRTYECISRHPAVRNPGWLDVQWMPRPLAEVAHEPGGNLKATRRGPLHASLDKNHY